MKYSSYTKEGKIPTFLESPLDPIKLERKRLNFSTNNNRIIIFTFVADEAYHLNDRQKYFEGMLLLRESLESGHLGVAGLEITYYLISSFITFSWAVFWSY